MATRVDDPHARAEAAASDKRTVALVGVVLAGALALAAGLRPPSGAGRQGAPVRVVLADGDAVAGRLFEAPDGVLTVVRPDGSEVMLTRARVARIEPAAPEAAPVRVERSEDTVEIETEDGTVRVPIADLHRALGDEGR